MDAVCAENQTHMHAMELRFAHPVGKCSLLCVHLAQPGMRSEVSGTKEHLTPYGVQLFFKRAVLPARTICMCCGGEEVIGVGT